MAYWSTAALFAISTIASSLSAADITLYVSSDSPPAHFAAREIERVLKDRGDHVTETDLRNLNDAPSGRCVILAASTNEGAIQQFAKTGGAQPSDLRNEGFHLSQSGSGQSQITWVLGGGPGGVMYGGLELAEQISLKGLDHLEAMDRNPYLAMRGTKFNLPLDVRTPSYSDASESAQQNIAEVWSFEFWTAYLDKLARDRYNFVSLWNLHPFPSLVKVPEYPDVALDDVQRSTIKWKENYSTHGTGLDTPEILGHVETLKKITIDQKIAFWRRVMQYAKDRNIEFYIVTWNIFTNGTGGKYGITDSIDNPVTVDYFRKSVKQLLLTYPLLAGVGMTMGENMGDANFERKEAWGFATYGRGTLDVATVQPERKLRFIHRQHEVSAQAIAEAFVPVIKQPNVNFVFSFKYAQAHALSSTKQTFDHGFTETLGDLKTIWTVRNDDALMFRWGAPDFVREFIKNMPYKASQGFYYGSDMWIWGREFLSREPETPRQLEVEKHWYHWMLWGRLGYDPTIGNDRLVAILGHRYPDISAQALFDVWQHASMIYPLTTGFHWVPLDFQWYIEGSRSRPEPAQTASGFHDVNRFINCETHPGTDNISISRYVKAVTSGEKLTGTSPVEVSDKIQAQADAALSGVEKINPGANKELRQTLSDIRAMALLGKYYGYKIRGATELALYRKTNESRHQQAAIDQLTQASDYWNRYTTLADSLYKNPLWTNRVGYVDWKALNHEVAGDIEIARQATAASPNNKHD